MSICFFFPFVSVSKIMLCFHVIIVWTKFSLFLSLCGCLLIIVLYFFLSLFISFFLENISPILFLCVCLRFKCSPSHVSLLCLFLSDILLWHLKSDISKEDVCGHFKHYFPTTDKRWSVSFPLEKPQIFLSYIFI